jgi:diguanylate cyclase (GGDEF)-like protein
MINVTAQELEAILATVDKALDMHAQWREQLQRSLICKLPPREADMANDAHEQCAFGQWFYSPANAHLRKLPVFKRIEELHEEMHGHARELCIRVKGHWAITPKEYDPFIHQVAVFREALINLRHKVEETRHNIDPLTGALACDLLLTDLKKEQAAQGTRGQPYSLLLLRFDLAQINHKHGYTTGDALLRTSIASVRQSLAPGEKIYRHRGAEFVICLPGKPHEEADATREQLLAAINAALVSMQSHSAAPLQVHYGIAELVPDKLIDQLISETTLASYSIQL